MQPGSGIGEKLAWNPSLIDVNELNQMNTKTVFSLLVSVLSLVATTGRAAPSPNAEPRQELAWKYEYDEGDRLVKTVDPAGRATQLQYSFYDTNRLRKLVRTGDDGASVTREFDETGRLTRMTDGAGIVSYTYDDRGRLNRIARQGTHAIAYTYDTLDRITSLQVGDFYRIDYAYDFLGRLASMKTPAGLVTYDYQTGLGQVVRSLPNGVKTFWKRQPNGELEEITHGFFKNRDDRKYSVLAQYAYTHGPDGKITAIRERSGQGEFTRHYAYDNMGRLVSATGPGGKAYGYAYDLVGNRVKATATGRPDQVCTYDWAGRLTSVDGKPCAYDACGNLTEATLDGVDRQYRYQPDGRLAEARIGGEAVLYLYDGFGRLVTRKTTVGETWCIPDPLSPYWQPLVMQETDGRRTLVIWDGSSPLALVREGKAEWLLHDFLGSVRVVTEANGTMTRYCEYDPCGMGESKEQNSLPLAPGFTGLLWDSHAYCYLALARTFNPRTGSFLEPDPQKRMPTPSAEDHSLYLYCSGDPLNLVDMDGAESREPVSFDSHERWMDAFERAWWYNTVGAPIRWLYRLGGGRPTGLAVNLDPNERDYMISAVISEAKKRVGENPGALHALLKEWRENLSLRPEQFRRTTVTAHEWKVLENAAYRDVLSSRTTRDVLINDGHIPALIANSVTRDGSRAPDLLIKAGTLKWEVSHGIGELTGLPPSFFDKRTEGPWLTTTPATKKAYEYGLSHWAQGNVDVRREPNPSPVGGVYLGGAGGAVAGLGPLKGIRTDANGNLVLVSEEGGDVKLPPLRLDDVVTVFRSVYLHGEGPTVTIDPNPDDPEKSA